MKVMSSKYSRRLLSFFHGFKSNKNINNQSIKVHLQESLKNKIHFQPQHYFNLNLLKLQNPQNYYHLNLIQIWFLKIKNLQKINITLEIKKGDKSSRDWRKLLKNTCWWRGSSCAEIWRDSKGNDDLIFSWKSSKKV